MKLIIAIVQDEDVSNLIEELTKEQFRVTKLASTGGFLKSGNTTLLIGVEDEKIYLVTKIVERICQVRETTTSMTPLTLPGNAYVPYPINIKVGGATMFVVDVERYEKI